MVRGKPYIIEVMKQVRMHPPDHNYYFSYRTLQQLLEQIGLECRQIYYYQALEGKGFARHLDHTLTTCDGSFGRLR